MKHTREQRWLLGRDTGMSSLTIFSVLTKDVFLRDIALQRCGGGPSTPFDRSDFGRCYRLLIAVPKWRKRIKEVAKKHRVWRPLVDNWDELEELYLDGSDRLSDRIKELT